jgi:thioredoxin-related protein
MTRRWFTILGILFATTLFAAQSNGRDAKNLPFKAAMQKAAHEGKLLLLMVSQEGCPMCIYMKNNTLKDADVSRLIAQNFVFVEKENADEDLPEKFEAFVTPTFFVIDPKTATQIDSPIHGGFKPPAFMRILKLYIEERKPNHVQKNHTDDHHTSGASAR